MKTNIIKNPNNNSNQETLNLKKNQLPQNIEAEQNILGIILYNNEQFDKISELINYNQFFDPLHGKIFNACFKMITRGQLASPITLKSMFSEDELFSDLQNGSYLQQLVDGIGNLSALEAFAEEVRNCYLRRELILIGEKLIGDANYSNVDYTAENQIEYTESQLYNLAENGKSSQGPLDFGNVLAETITNIEKASKNKGKLSGLDTGLDSLNKKLGGLHSSDLIILAGRPAMGKTALATNIAFNAASPVNINNAPETVIFFSLEMSSVQLATRILSERTEINSENLRLGKDLDEGSFNKIVKANTDIYESPFYIDETPAVTLAQISNRSRRLKRKLGGKLGLIVIDYIQLIMSQKNSFSENRVQELSAITRGLKALAKELNVPVLALSQLSRAVEQREDKRPNLSDLRESGSIEQDADVVMFVFREEYYHEKSEPIRKSEETEQNYNERYQNWQSYAEKIKGQAQVIISKQRHGPTGTAMLSFTDRFTKFGNLIREDNIPEGF